MTLLRTRCSAPLVPQVLLLPKHSQSRRLPGKPLNLYFQANNHTLAFATDVYWLELDHRRVRRLFTARAGRSRDFSL